MFPSAAHNTPLLLAIERGNAEMVRLLLADPRVDANARNSDGATPLILACAYGLNEIVKCLLGCGRISVNEQNAVSFEVLIGESLLEFITRR